MSFAIDRLTIRQMTNDDSMEVLTELLHRSYKQLADMGLKFLATHQSVDVTRKRLSKGVGFVGEYNSDIVATLTYKPPQTHTLPDLKKYDNTAWLGQLAVEPQFQRNGIANALMDHVEQFAIDTRVPKIAVDTAEPAEHLIEWYKRRGYSFVDFVDWEITNYRSVILIKDLSL